MEFVAACANCASWNGACAQGLAPPTGEPRCGSYQISDSFASLLAGHVLQANPMKVLVPTRPLSGSARRKVARLAKPRPRRGFRS